MDNEYIEEIEKICICKICRYLAFDKLNMCKFELYYSNKVLHYLAFIKNMSNFELYILRRSNYANTTY